MGGERRGSAVGGTLLIGVADETHIVGLDQDYATLHKEGKQDSDLLQLHLGHLVENAVGLAAAANVTFTIHHLDGHDVCRVHIGPSGHPVWAEVTDVDEHGQFVKKQAFLIRYNNGTRSIGEERERQRYIAQRWGNGETSPGAQSS